jgi:hypothetical protein
LNLHIDFLPVTSKTSDINKTLLFRSRQHVPTGQSADVVQKLGGRVVVDVTVVVGVVVAVVVAEVGVVVPDCVVVDDIGIMI